MGWDTALSVLQGGGLFSPTGALGYCSCVALEGRLVEARRSNRTLSLFSAESISAYWLLVRMFELYIF